MRLAASMTLIAIGAILALAVHLPHEHVINLTVVGLILMLVGIIGHLLSPSWAATYRRLTTIERASAEIETVEADDPLPNANGPAGRPGDSSTRDSVAYLLRPPLHDPESRRTGT